MAKYQRVYLAPNNGEIGGGEVMLLRIAEALRSLGVDVTVVAPQPSAVLDAAQAAGHPTIGLAAADRVGWMRALRRWDRARRDGLLWCNGLVPSFATSGRRGRIVHLHQHPTGLHRMLARSARWGAVTVLVPSHDMLRAAKGARVLQNWTVAPTSAARADATGDVVRVGLLGRLGHDKGVQVLAEAMRMLEDREPGRYRMLLGGEPLFVSDDGVAQLEQTLRPVAALTERLGWIDTTEFFDRVDVLTVPSVVRESFGLVAAEAMAARVPLIVSDAGALPEVVGPDGEVVPAGDAVALAARIAAVMSDADAGEARKERADALHVRWQQEFSPGAGRDRVGVLMDDLGVVRQS